MIIRQEQMVFLSQGCLGKFEKSMAEHLNRCFPDKCKALGEQGIQEVIRYGIKRAASHHITLERDVCKYIDLMFAFGREFDSNPDLPWASRILEDGSFKNATAKVDRLFDTAKLQKTAEAWSPLQ